VFSNRISQALHEDHCASALMERRDGLIAAIRKQSPGTTASATARCCLNSPTRSKRRRTATSADSVRQRRVSNEK
jgi:hypothetical protein